MTVTGIHKLIFKPVSCCLLNKGITRNNGRLTICCFPAVDRAHRIGQKKPVQVFRLISEGTVEEKIIERADRKLFLDAAVIQQGRLAEQNSSLEKDELMKMVRFGADQILSGHGGTYTDEDIDALIAKGEEKTSAIQARLETDAQHNLANFSLLAECLR